MAMAFLLKFPLNKKEPLNKKGSCYTLGHVKFQYPRRFRNLQWTSQLRPWRFRNVLRISQLRRERGAARMKASRLLRLPPLQKPVLQAVRFRNIRWTSQLRPWRFRNVLRIS